MKFGLIRCEIIVTSCYTDSTKTDVTTATALPVNCEKFVNAIFLSLNFIEDNDVERSAEIGYIAPTPVKHSI